MLNYKYEKFGHAARAVTFVMLLTGLLSTSRPVRAADVPDSDQVSQLLSEAKAQAFQLKEDAATLQTFTSSNLNWQQHAAVLNQMKEHVNEAGRQLTKLEDNLGSASPWQKTAIERIRPLLRELASNTEGVINSLNQHPQQLRTGEYKDYVEANADLSDQLSEMIGDFVDYGKTKHRFERLAAKLEVAGPGTF